ncbi:FabD/lysophospholipase-like protein [Serendipita vermifera]|nr:FabD/lysophospholipase-like protein [Serendipita vermifera]
MPTKTDTGLRLLSLDGSSGPQAFSQLEILREIMNRIQFNIQQEDPDKIVRPCDYFDMIGGIGTGGMFAVMFTALHMSVGEVMEEFVKIRDHVYAKDDLAPIERTTRLRRCLEDMMNRRGGGGNVPITQSQGDHRCKGFVMTTITENVQTKVKFRTYEHQMGPSISATVVDAIMATCVSEPDFEPITIGSASPERTTYLSGPMAYMNPVREVIAEAYKTFPNPEDRYVASILSIGNGHPGVVMASTMYGSDNEWVKHLRPLLTNCENTANEVASQMEGLGIYHRFSVLHGLEHLPRHDGRNIEYLRAQAASYCDNPEFTSKIDICVKSMQSSAGISSLSQLVHPGGGTIGSKSLPAITPNFVMRNEPWQRLIEAMIECHKEEFQKVVVVSGMAGCGKTQLCTKFVHDHRSRFERVISIDGSSESSIRADLTTQIRSMRPKYSQSSFDDALLYLRDSRNMGWFLLIDNVDDVTIDLGPFLPDCNHGHILITTRNRLLGSFASRPEWHIELDVMSEDEAVSVLCNAIPTSRDSESQPALREVAKELGYLPIALAQAGSYMRESICGADEYLQIYKRRRNQLLKYRGTGRQKASVYAAFDVSFQRIPPPIQNFLFIISHYHFASFPVAAFGHAGKADFRLEPYPYLQRDEVFEKSISLLRSIFFECDQQVGQTVHKIIWTLQSYSMASFTPGFKTTLLRLHPLFHDWITDQTPSNRKLVLISSAVRILACGRGESWMEPYFTPHIRHLMRWHGLENVHINDQATMGRIMREAGQLDDSQKLWVAVHQALENMEGDHRLDIADCKLEMAWTYPKFYINGKRSWEMTMSTLCGQSIGLL